MAGPSNIKRLKAAFEMGGLEVPRGDAERGIGHSVQKSKKKEFVQDPDGRQRVVEKDVITTDNRGVDPSVATQQADTFRAMFDKAGVESQNPNIGDSAYDNLADVIQSYQREYAAEIADNNPTIIAPMVDALMNLDLQTRQMVLDKAGDPEIFRNLRNAELDTSTSDGVSRDSGVQQAKEVADAEAKELPADDRRRLPVMYRLSSIFGKPDSKNEKGQIVSGTKGYKKDELKPDPTLDTPVEDLSQSARMLLLRRLANDQLQQVNAIEVDPKTKKPTGRIATLPSTDPEVPTTRDQLKVGTDRAPEDPGMAVQNRNRDVQDRILEHMYAATQPRQRTDRQGNVLRGLTDAVGDSSSAERLDSVLNVEQATDTTIPLDRYFPWWRSRFAELDADGNLAYPPRMPSAEFITGVIMSQYKIPASQMGEFMSRMVPLVQRSIDAAPDRPPESYVKNPDGTFKIDENTGKRIPTPRSAFYYSSQVQLPSESFLNVMSQGVGTPDYPHPIYGDRQINVPEVQAPERHPFGTKKARDTDSASIYRGYGLPANSPMRMLMA